MNKGFNSYDFPGDKQAMDKFQNAMKFKEALFILNQIEMIERQGREIGLNGFTLSIFEVLKRAISDDPLVKVGKLKRGQDIL